MKGTNTIKWVILFVTVVIISAAAACQDSVTLKVTWSKKVNDTVYYIFKIMGTDEIKYKKNEKVKSFCVCKTEKKRGEKVLVAVRDLEFIKPTF